MSAPGFVTFRCDRGGNLANADLCLNDGTCAMSPEGLESCVCPAGYGHDFTVGHFQNCGLSNATLASMCGITTAATIIALFIAGPIFYDLKAHAKRILGLAMTTAIVSWACFLAVWTQGGMYEAGLLLLFLRNILNFRCLVGLALMFTTPIYAILKTNLDRFKAVMLALEGFNFVAQLAATIALLVFCRDQDPARYNSAMVIFLFIFSSMTVIMSGAILRQVIMLQNSIKSGSPTLQAEPKMVGFNRRLSKMKKMSASLVLTFGLIYVFPITILVLGSFPGQFILCFFLFLIAPSFSARGALLLRIEGDGNSESGSRAVSMMDISRDQQEKARSMQMDSDSPRSMVRTASGYREMTVRQKMLTSQQKAQTSDLFEQPVDNQESRVPTS